MFSLPSPSQMLNRADIRLDAKAPCYKAPNPLMGVFRMLRFMSAKTKHKHFHPAHWCFRILFSWRCKQLVSTLSLRFFSVFVFKSLCFHLSANGAFSKRFVFQRLHFWNHLPKSLLFISVFGHFMWTISDKRKSIHMMWSGPLMTCLHRGRGP